MASFEILLVIPVDRKRRRLQVLRRKSLSRGRPLPQMDLLRLIVRPLLLGLTWKRWTMLLLDIVEMSWVINRRLMFRTFACRRTRGRAREKEWGLLAYTLPLIWLRGRLTKRTIPYTFLLSNIPNTNNAPVVPTTSI